MKLSTKHLFTTLKNRLKNKTKNIHKQTLRNNISRNNNFILNFNHNKNLYLNQNSPNENPFQKFIIHPNRLKSKSKLRNKIIELNPNNNKQKLKTNLYEFNNFYSINIEINRYKPKIEKKNKNENKIEYNLDILCDIFRKSNFRSTNIKKNLNLEEENIITSKYFNKNNRDNANKNRINILQFKKYNKSNKVVKPKSCLLWNKKTINFFTHNKEIKRSIDNYNFKSNKINKNIKQKSFFQGKLLLSTKENIKKNIIRTELFDIMSEKEKSEKEKSEKKSNSLFDNYNNKSIHSSFLGSSLENYV